MNIDISMASSLDWDFSMSILLYRIIYSDCYRLFTIYSAPKLGESITSIQVKLYLVRPDDGLSSSSFVFVNKWTIRRWLRHIQTIKMKLQEHIGHERIWLITQKIILIDFTLMMQFVNHFSIYDWKFPELWSLKALSQRD